MLSAAKSVGLLALLALLAAAAHARSAPALPAPAEAALRNAIDDALAQLRDVILNGDPEAGIPVLDPFVLDHFDFAVYEPPTQDVAGSLSDVRVEGAGAFVVEKSRISISLLPPRATITVEVRVPSVSGAGEYELSGQAQLNGQDVPLNAAGDFSVVVNDIFLGVKAVVTLSYNVKSVDVTLGLGGVDILVQGAGSVGAAINAEAAARIEEWFAANRSDLEAAAAELVKQAIEQALSTRRMELQ